MGETRVDLQHLLEDLRDAYTGPLEETILTEVIANALDSGASRIRLLTSATDRRLTIVDDGRGMLRRELARYHDVAASSKTRGEGIGFAGVGIKLGLLVAQEVVTESRRGATHVATRWHLASRHRAPWKWITPPGLTSARGTAVQLLLTNPLSPLLDAAYVEEIVRRHFEPLLDPAFEELLIRHYRHPVMFEVDNGRIGAAGRNVGERAPLAVRLGRRRIPSAIGFLERRPSLPVERHGIAISTFGKIIKRGWEWIGISPVDPAISGLIEVPELASCLTLNKSDFVRTGSRGATYLGYRKAIQDVVSRQLAAWGDSATGDSRPRPARLERDLERVLEDLAEDFPLLQSLVDRRPGGQKRLPMPGRGDEHAPGPLFAEATAGGDGANGGAGAATPPGEPASGESPRALTPTQGGEPREYPPAIPTLPGPAEPAVAGADTIAARRRPARYGLLVQFESRTDDLELARLVDNTVWVNDAHPAYLRAATSRALGYHTALAVALCLAPLAVGASEEHAFLTQFLAHWGGAASSARPHGRGRARRSA